MLGRCRPATRPQCVGQAVRLRLIREIYSYLTQRIVIDRYTQKFLRDEQQPLDLYETDMVRLLAYAPTQASNPSFGLSSGS